ncbi:MAG: hypothetical protein BYD32DRAFT_486850 [Podila humilis]|nr:MAG: hypothetical protein BYD32DRAFT_486850 [Podila humilis]
MQELKTRNDISERLPQAKRRTAIGYEDMVKLKLHLQKPTTIETESLGRFDKVLKLKRGDVLFRFSDSEGPPWFTITVPSRNSNLIDPAQANVYKIYSQLDEPHACCVIKLLSWIKWIEMHLQCELTAGDFLIPEFTNGDIDLQKHSSSTQLSTLLNRYANDTGLMKHQFTHFDTHCFHRGGARHRLFHAQEKWLFQSVR